MKPFLLTLCLLLFPLATPCLGQNTAAASGLDPGSRVPPGPEYNHTQPGPAGAARLSLADVPLFFEANQGQIDSRVRFFSRGSGYTLFLTPDETVLVESAHPNFGRKSAIGRDQKPLPRSVLRMKLVGKKSVQEFVGAGQLPGKVNYLIGNQPSAWHTGVPLYSEVRAEQVYPGVDLRFHGDAQQLEYDFVVSPEADPNQVVFQIAGAERIELNPHGDLVLHTQANEVTFHKPLVYQPVGAKRRLVAGDFVLKGAGQVGFALAPYDHRQPLVIDPTITYATFLGGAGQEDGDNLSLDTSTPGAPKMYIGGTTSDDTTFPETGSNVTFLTKPGASEYVFVAKIDPTLTGAPSLDYLTFIGGATPLPGTGSPCDNHFGSMTLETISSNVEPLMSGITTCQDFPVTQPGTPGTGTNDIFLTRLTSTGAALDRSELFGGNGQQVDIVVRVSSSGDVVLSSLTSSTNLAATSGAYAAKLDNGQSGASVDCFVARLDSTFSVSYLTYLNVGAGQTLQNLAGGDNCGVVEDSSGKIIAYGSTLSASDFSGISGQPNGFQTKFQGTADTFVMKLDSTLSGTKQLVYSTYLGGGGTTVPDSEVYLNGTNLFVIAGNTISGEPGYSPNIPLANAYQTTNNADTSSFKGTGFVTVIDTTQTGSASLPCSTYLGGTGGDEKVEGAAYDPQNGAFSTVRLVLSGQTSSTTFPTLNPIQQSLVGSQDGWLAVMNVPVTSSGPTATLSFSSYLGDGYEPPGGPDGMRETIRGVAADPNHYIYARGRSLSPSPYFFGNTNPPTTVNGFQVNCASCQGVQGVSNPEDDIVIFQLEGWQPAVAVSPASLKFSGQVVGTTSAAQQVKVTNSGSAPVSLLPLTASGDFALSSDGCSNATLAAAGDCTFDVSFTPTINGSVPGEITITDTAEGSPQLVNLTKASGLKPIALAPASIKFGTIAAGSTSAPATLTLTNNLATSLTVNSITASGDYAVESIGKTPCTLTGMTLASKKKCTFGVTFTPTQNASAISGTATVAYQAEFSPIDVALTGGGSGGSNSPLTFNPASGSFKNVPAGGSATQTVMVTNSSASSVKITALTASANYSATGCVGSLAPNASCTMTVSFNPSISGTISGSVAIANNTNVNPEIYDISGTAVLPLVFTPKSHTFGSQTVGSTSAPFTFTLNNYASTTMNLGIVASGDFGVVPGSKTPCGATLSAGGKCTIGVTFTPSATGKITGAATVSYSGVSPSFSPQEISLAGTGK